MEWYNFEFYELVVYDYVNFGIWIECGVQDINICVMVVWKFIFVVDKWFEVDEICVEVLCNFIDKWKLEGGVFFES